VNLKSSTGKAMFYVPPKMTKWEVQEYLSKIYNVQVLKVNTELKLGESIMAALTSRSFLQENGRDCMGSEESSVIKEETSKRRMWIL
jgi:hypothetical protein